MDIAMKVTGVLIFATFGMASAGVIGRGNTQHHHPQDILTKTFVLAAAKLDGHAFIFQTGLGLSEDPLLEIGEAGVMTVFSGFLTTEAGHMLSVEDGLLYCHALHPRNTEAIRSALSRVDMTLEKFIQHTGTNSPQVVYEVITGVISISGTYRNVDAAVIFVMMVEVMDPSTEGQGPVLLISPASTGDQTTGLIWNFTYAAAKLDGHANNFLNGALLLKGYPLEIGEDGVFPVVSGFLTTEAGHHHSVDGGLLYVHALHPRNTEAIRNALSRADMTLEHFIQQTGSFSQSQKILEVTAGVISISGTYRSINAAVLFVISDVIEPSIKAQIVVTEAAVPETLTVSQSVTLIKTSTHDEYTTITSPVYNSAVVTYTNFLRQTVTVTEEQVIQSPVAGSVVVKTIPVSTQLVLTVTDTATNYFVSSALETVTSTLQHFAPNFSFKTITVNNIITSTVIHTITRTSISTAYITNTVGSTVYSTTVRTVTISHGPAATETIPVYY